MQISIDGPAGAGKTSSAKALAKELGYTYVDTGAIYRAVALYAKRKGVPAGGKEMADVLPEIAVTQSDGTVRLNGEDVSQAIREPDISMLSSDVSKDPSVRKFATETARNIAGTTDSIMEGRDIGSVVLPGADMKFYLTADLLARAERRFQDIKAKGQEIDPLVLAKEVYDRDRQDMTREHDPLVVPAGAMVIDNTNMSLKKTVDVMLQCIRNPD